MSIEDDAEVLASKRAVMNEDGRVVWMTYVARGGIRCTGCMYFIHLLGVE